MLKPIWNKQEVTADPFSKTVWTTYFFRHLHVHIFTFSQQSKPGLSATRLSGIISRAEEHQLHHPVLQGWRKFLGKTTNKHAAEEWMDFIVKPKTWSRHRLRGLGRDWSLFIHKCWKGSVHTPHVEVLFLNQVHMAALLCPRQHEMFRARRGGRFWVTVLNRNDALDTGIWWRGNNAAPQLSPEPPHTWRQLYQTVFSGNSPQLKTNSYPSVSPPSVFLLLARTCGSKPSSCLQRSSWSLSPPLQRCPAHDERLSRSYFKFQDKKNREALVVLPCFDLAPPPPNELSFPPLKVSYSHQALTSYQLLCMNEHTPSVKSWGVFHTGWVCVSVGSDDVITTYCQQEAFLPCRDVIQSLCEEVPGCESIIAFYH